MIEEQTIVTQVGLGQVWIKSLQTSACSGCMQQTTCGTATVAKLLPKREFAVACEFDLKVGDKVWLAIDDSHLLLSSVLMYLVPLILMLAGVLSANVLLPAALVDTWLPAIALLVLLLAFVLIHRFQDFLLLRFCFKPAILDKR